MTVLIYLSIYLFKRPFRSMGQFFYSLSFSLSLSVSLSVSLSIYICLCL